MYIVIKTDLETKPKKCKECPFFRGPSSCIAGLKNVERYKKLSGADGFPYRRNYSNAIPIWCPLIYR